MSEFSESPVRIGRLLMHVSRLPTILRRHNPKSSDNISRRTRRRYSRARQPVRALPHGLARERRRQDRAQVWAQRSAVATRQVAIHAQARFRSRRRTRARRPSPRSSFARRTRPSRRPLPEGSKPSAARDRRPRATLRHRTDEAVRSRQNPVSDETFADDLESARASTVSRRARAGHGDRCALPGFP